MIWSTVYLAHSERFSSFHNHSSLLSCCLLAIVLGATLMHAVCWRQHSCMLCVGGNTHACCVLEATLMHAVCWRQHSCMLCVGGNTRACCVLEATLVHAVCWRQHSCMLCVGGNTRACCVLHIFMHDLHIFYTILNGLENH